MGAEAIDYRDIGRDIYAEARDGDLTQEEREELITRYEEECSTVQADTCNNLQELRDAMDTFQESLQMDRGDIIKLQRIIGVGSDGYFGPGSFTSFESYKTDTGFEGTLEELVVLYGQTREHFENLPIAQRRDLQPERGKDGIFGPNTFRYMLSQNLVEGVEQVVVAVEEVSQGDPAVIDSPDLRDIPTDIPETGFEITRDTLTSTIEMAFQEENRDIIFQALQSDVLRGNTERSQNYIREIQAYIIENNVYEQARSIFCNPETSLEDTGTIYTVDFRGERTLTQLITAIDLFGDVSYLKDSDGTFIRRYEPSGEYRTLDGRRLSIVSGTSVMVPNEQEIIRIGAYMSTIERGGVSAVDDPTLGVASVFETSVLRNGRPIEVNIFSREQTLGEQALTRLITPEAAESIRIIMEAGQDRFFPVLMNDGSIVFMTNPTYAPDTDGEGVSSVEARNYAMQNGYLLPTSFQTDAARDQAQIRGILPSNYNEHVTSAVQQANTARQRALLEEIIGANGDAFVGGFTKIWAFNESLPVGHSQRREHPGLNGWYSNVRTGETIQGYSTWHAGDPSYDDYSQAAQFVSPVWIDAAGNIHGLSEGVLNSPQLIDPLESGRMNPELEIGGSITLDDVINMGVIPERTPQAEDIVPVIQEARNAIGMTERAFETAKIEIRNSPEYREAREIARRLSRQQIMNIQLATGAEVDGAFGPETYLFYAYSDVSEAGFTLEEVANLRKIVDEESDIQAITSAIQQTYNLSDEAITDIFGDISADDYISYNVYWGEITHFDQETTERRTINVAEGIFDTIERALTEGSYEVILETLSRMTDAGQRGHYIDTLLEYIRTNNAYNQALALFSNIGMDEQGNQFYSINFHGNVDLGLKITADDLFNTEDYLIVENTLYVRDGQSYISTSGNQVLELRNRTIVRVPQESEKDEIRTMLTERESIRTSIENNLGEVIQSHNREMILNYCRIASESEKRQLLENIKNIVFEQRLFSDMRAIFTIPGENGAFIFQDFSSEIGVGRLFADGLVAFDIFGDYSIIASQGVEYVGLRGRDYMNNQRRFALNNGERVIPQMQSQRREEDYETLDEYPELAREFGEWVTRQRLSGVRNDCGGAVGDLLVRFGLTQFRREEGNRFSQLSQQLGSSSRNGYAYEHVLDQMVEEGYFSVEDIATPADARPGGIIVFGRGAPRSSGASTARQYAGHVEIKGSDNHYYSYYSSSVPGGSARSFSTDAEIYASQTAFVGKVYYPRVRF